MSKSVPKAPPDKVALYEAVLATIPEIERKGATMPYTAVNGNMFSFLTPEGSLALRLPEAELATFLQRQQTTLCVQHGVVMKEYALVPAALLENTRELAKFLEISHRYASSLKAKPTTRKKTTPSGKKNERGDGTK